MSAMTDHDLELLAATVRQLERQSLAGKLAALVGMPVDKLLGWLPQPIQGQIDRVAEDALRVALTVAVKTMDDETRLTPWNLSHKVAATLSGVTGGMFGAPALAVELPVTTVIIMRSIADIARSKGEGLSDPMARLACLEVFALGSGGKQAPDDTAEVMREGSRAREGYVRTTYFVARAAMAQQVTAAAEILTKGSAASSSSALTRLISNIASRFGLAVSEKAAAQAVPIVGAVGGGLINALFMDHFQNTAEAHFTVRKLERQYGADLVRKEYERLAGKARLQVSGVS
jgi:hypothetical protein